MRVESRLNRWIRFIIGGVGFLILALPWLIIHLLWFIPPLPVSIIFYPPIHVILTKLLVDPNGLWYYLADFFAMAVWYHLSFGMLPKMLYAQATTGAK